MSAAKTIHDVLIPRVARVAKPLPSAIVEKLAAQGVRVAARQQAVAARMASGKGAGKGLATGGAAKVSAPAAPARSLANATPTAEPAQKMMLDRSKAVSVKELPDGTIKVQLAPNAAAIHAAMTIGKGKPGFADAIAAAMGPAADEALATIAKAAPDAKVRVMAGSTEMGTRNVAPSPSAPVRAAPAPSAPVVASPASPVASPPAVVVPSPAALAPAAPEASAPAAPAASPATPPGKPATPPGKPS